ncbi:MAG TPA: type II toxin-antitoxin system VapC family toxin [Pararhizobium sp.]|nr:type II toxin-antitoxin system VapC family toxin [Pararhizobium sp.]
MKFLLDTNAVIAILKGHEGFLARLQQYRPADFGLPSIVAHELFYGACKSQRVEENLRRVEGLQFGTVSFDREDARCAGELRARLAASGTPIGPYDVLIAGQALARRLTVVTRNMREFNRVEGLPVEDWEG